MKFTSVRRLMFQFHMWIGLILGILLALLGLSGSAIVYDDEIANFLNPPPVAVAQGPALSLDAIAAAALSRVGGREQVQIGLPVIPGKIVTVRVGQQQRGEGAGPSGERGPIGNGMQHRRGGRRRAEGGGTGAAGAPGRPGLGQQVFVDPVSGAVLGARAGGLPSFLGLAHQLHGNFLMGRAGRTYVVGPLGVAMCILGITGLVLWWPKRGQWKYAFLIRRTAQGLRFHRELHSAVGIWMFVVFMAVSFSGVVLSWPSGAPGVDPRAPAPSIDPAGDRIGADAALALAKQAVPDAIPRSITLPAREDQPITVSFGSNGAMGASVAIDPYRSQTLTVRNPASGFWAWQRPLHQGSLGPVWRFLVFLSGLIPLLFVVTGITMWWKKYRNHISMSSPLALETGE